MTTTLIRPLILIVCMAALNGCFDSSSKNNNDNSDKSKASVQMQKSDADADKK